MLETIVSWLLSACTDILDKTMSAFWGLLDFSLTRLYELFPYFGTAYSILQACGLGLVLAIASVNLFKFFLGNIGKAQDSPMQILVRSIIATLLIYLGGYLLSAIVGIAKVPYDIFVKSNAVSEYGLSAVLPVIDIQAYYGKGAASLLAAFILIIAIGWNLIKLLLEVVERYLMVGVLVYTSPLMYPFLTSAGTSQVFQRWVGMFCGECALMSLSVLFTKLAVSALASGPSSIGEIVTTGNRGDYLLVKMIMCLAMCKIAQRVDTYMQQLGIGVPTTGEGFLGDAIAVGSALKRTFGGGLQKAASGESLANDSRLGNILPWKRRYNDAFAQGNSDADSRASSAAAKAYAKRGAAGNWDANQFTPYKANAVAVAKRSQESSAAWQEKVRRQSRPAGEQGGGRTTTEDFQGRARAMGMSSQQFARMNLQKNGAGVGLAGTSGDNNADFELSPEAKNAGLMTSFPFGKDGGGLLTGPDAAVASHIQDNFDGTQLSAFEPNSQFYNADVSKMSPDELSDMETQREDSSAAYQSTLANTLAHGSPFVAQEVLFNDRKNISGNDVLAQSALANTFGDCLHVGNQTGTQAAERLSNIRAETQPLYTDKDGNQWGGGRVVSGLCEVPGHSGRTYEDGTEVPKMKRLEIMDETAYKQMSPIQRAQMQPMPSKTGEVFYARAMDVDQTTGNVADWSRAVQQEGNLQDMNNPRFEQGRPVAQNIAASTLQREDGAPSNSEYHGRGQADTYTSERPTGGVVERSSDGVIERPSSGTYERTSDGFTERPSGGTYERTSDGFTERPTGGTIEREAARSAEPQPSSEPRTVVQNTVVNQAPDYTPVQHI